MRLTEARPGTRVLAFGGYQPARVLTNEELAATYKAHKHLVNIGCFGKFGTIAGQSILVPLDPQSSP